MFTSQKQARSTAKSSMTTAFALPKLKNCLIPLEIIYRNGLPEGSSVLRRLAQGSITLPGFG